MLIFIGRNKDKIMNMGVSDWDRMELKDKEERNVKNYKFRVLEGLYMYILKL